VDRETKEGEGEAEMKGVGAMGGTMKQKFWILHPVSSAGRGEDAALKEQIAKKHMRLSTKE
jgi:hypothetical protein